MTEGIVVDIVTKALLKVLVISAPPLLAGLIVGVIISVLQTVTSIQEPTLAFIPKILAIFVSIIIFGSFMLQALEEFFVYIYLSIPELIVPR